MLLGPFVLGHAILTSRHFSVASRAVAGGEVGSADRRKVLILIDNYLPGYRAGGMLRSVAATVRMLRDDFEFLVVTSDRDLGQSTPYPDVHVDAWNTPSDGTRVFYCSSVAPIKRLVRERSPDVVYIQGIFSFRFSIWPLLRMKRLSPRPPILVAPRGMLEADALAIKRLKKRAFLWAARVIGLHNGVVWHASSESEASAVKAVFGATAQVEVAMDLSMPSLTELMPRDKRVGEVRLVFLSRIVRNKGLLDAIRLVKRVRPSVRVHLGILGPIEDPSYWIECQNEMRLLPDHVTIEYNGAVEHGHIHQGLAASHFLLLPTRFENFGHVVLEAFASGCPAIISDQTPWRGLSGMQLGWDISLDQPEAFVKAIEEAATMDGETYRMWSESAYRFAQGYVQDASVRDSHRAMLSRLTQVEE